jgi:cyclic pyranopterin phosphate synthase
VVTDASAYEGASSPAVPRPRRALPVLPVLPVLPDASEVVTRPDPRSVRISVTDRCDLACTYCRPSRSDGYASSRLSMSEWERIIDGLLASGVRRFRLTGGEPLLHRGVVELVRMIASRGVSDLALTTNATRLDRLAQPLFEAGLMRLNVSIDSLRADRFRSITRGGDLAGVLRGLDAAVHTGFSPIKLNVVVLRGQNDDELEEIVQWAWARGFVPRFLEVMKIAEGAALLERDPTLFVSVAEMRERLSGLLEPGPAAREPDRGPAKYVAGRRAEGVVGFISGTSDTYCGDCDRLRVSSEGVLRPCLATDAGVATRDDRGAPTGEVVDLVRSAWEQKPDGAKFKGCTEPSAARVSMRAIGG